MTRGDLVIVVLAGDYGKPRPAVVVQSDTIEGESVLVCPLTTSEREALVFRLTVEPLAGTGLRQTSQIMVDKIAPVRRARCGPVIGRLDEDILGALNEALALVVGLADR